MKRSSHKRFLLIHFLMSVCLEGILFFRIPIKVPMCPVLFYNLHKSQIFQGNVFDDEPF